MTKIKPILSILSAIASLVAAGQWFRSTLVSVPLVEKPDENGWVSASITSDGADVIATGREQNRWNRCAALFASIAALLQGISCFIPIDN